MPAISPTRFRSPTFSEMSGSQLTPRRDNSSLFHIPPGVNGAPGPQGAPGLQGGPGPSRRGPRRRAFGRE